MWLRAPTSFQSRFAHADLFFQLWGANLASKTHNFLQTCLPTNTTRLLYLRLLTGWRNKELWLNMCGELPKGFYIGTFLCCNGFYSLGIEVPMYDTSFTVAGVSNAGNQLIMQQGS